MPVPLGQQEAPRLVGQHVRKLPTYTPSTSPRARCSELLARWRESLPALLEQELGPDELEQWLATWPLEPHLLQPHDPQPHQRGLPVEELEPLSVRVKEPVDSEPRQHQLRSVSRLDCQALQSSQQVPLVTQPQTAQRPMVLHLQQPPLQQVPERDWPLLERQPRLV